MIILSIKHKIQLFGSFLLSIKKSHFFSEIRNNITRPDGYKLICVVFHILLSKFLNNKYSAKY